MIYIYARNNLLINSGDISVEGAIETGKKDTIMVYIEYTKGTEDNITVSFEKYEKSIDKWFPVQQDDGNSIVNYERTLNEGLYNIPIPVGKNEEKFKIKVKMNGNTSATGTVNVWLIPEDTRF